MRKIVVLVSVLFISLISFGQSVGIGKLKLGESMATIFATLIDGGYTGAVSFVENKSEYKHLEGNDAISEIVADTLTENESMDKQPHNKNMRVIYVPRYKVIPAIKIENVFMTFYNDKLIEIYCEGNSELEEALTCKFGEPKKDYKEGKKECPSLLGDYTVTRACKTDTWVWDTKNTSVTCEAAMFTFFDSNGELRRLGYNSFTLRDDTYNAEINNSNLKIRKKVQELDQQKKALENF